MAIKQISVHNGSGWTTADIGGYDNDITLSSTIWGNTNLRDLFNDLLPDSSLTDTRVLATNSNGTLTATDITVTQLNLLPTSPTQSIETTLSGIESNLTTYQNIVNNISALGQANLIDKIYPVGSIYITVSEITPATIFGGNWSLIQNFLMARGTTYTADNAVNFSITLTSSHLPLIQGSVAIRGIRTDSSTLNNLQGATGIFSAVDKNTHTAASTGYYSTSQTPVFNQITLNMGGSGTSFLLQPKYLPVYIWKRTS